jgi:hypothetical protein
MEEAADDEGGAQAIGRWREYILNKDGKIDWGRYARLAANYHQRESIDQRFGPKADDFAAGKAGATKTTRTPKARRDADDAVPLLPERFPGGLYTHQAGKWARLDGVGPDSEGSAGWIMSGQLLFAPDPTAPKEYGSGCANAMSADGYVGPDKGLCMRLRCQWTPDYWLRNSIATPMCPGIPSFLKEHPDLPLPPVAITRGVSGANVTGFLAFQNGVIGAVGTGNDQYTSEGFGYPSTRLPKGKVPTALAVTANNEFVFVTVWDAKEKLGQVAVIAVEGNLHTTNRKAFGLPGAWPSATRLKLLGFITLPFAAPNSIDVAINVVGGNPRGNAQSIGVDLSRQEIRDKWFAVPPGAEQDGALKWNQSGTRGHAIVASRAENRVAVIDLAPLLNYYRQMYFTTPQRYEQTTKLGTAKDAWPYTFEHAPEQQPKVVCVWKVQQPTAVGACSRAHTFFYHTRARQKGRDTLDPMRMVAVGTMEGSVLLFEVSALVGDAKGVIAKVPFRKIPCGRNPTHIFHGMHSTSVDDFFVVSRGDRQITHMEYDGTVRAVLRDRRLVDPVSCMVSMNQCGFGGSGKGKAAHTSVLSVMDFHGRQVVTYGVDHGSDGQGEKIDFTDEQGRVQPFLYFSTSPMPGMPFMFSVEEVI